MLTDTRGNDRISLGEFVDLLDKGAEVTEVDAWGREVILDVALLAQEEYVDLIIPRGGEGLIAWRIRR